jgi:hypothetical protein
MDADKASYHSPGCHALMPTAEEGHRESGTPMPADTTEIVHA